MEQSALKQLLNQLISTWESEVIEFKEVSNDFDTDKIGRYFSALSNECNLNGLEKAWLVFGVRNKTRSIVGTNYRPEIDRLQSLKLQIAQGTEPSITFRNIFELNDSAGRVLLFEIPAAPRGIPISWQGHYYSRSGESLSSLGVAKQDEIRNQTLGSDWTAQLVEGATLDHLYSAAVQRARDSFAQKYANRFSAAEVAGWPVEVLLDRARVTQGGKIARATLLLLGKPESAYLLSPNPAQITWKLEGPERAYEHFSPPFLLTTSQVFQRIRNIQLRLLPDNELLPYEVSKYDQKVVLEALHNCIAHQDYTLNGRIVVTELPDKLTFENEGGFFEGTPLDYIGGTKTPRRYRNPFLVQAMAELNMIDTMGYGIHRIHEEQRRRYFPMPDYDLSNGNSVCMTIYGGVVDPAYSRLLMENTGLQLFDVLALDRVQKQLPIPDETAQRLRRSRLIEGRKPNYHVSAAVAAATSTKADYIKNRSFDNHHYEEMITTYLKKFGSASRKEIDDLLWDKLSNALDEKQKKNKINNLISELRIKGEIANAASRASPDWRLKD